MKLRRALLGSASGLLVIVCAGGAVHAQPVATPPATPSAEPDSTAVEEVVVTAENRPTARRNVAGGVNVLSDALLDEARVNDVEDVTRLVPGFELGRSSGEQLSYPTIRGVSPQVFGDPTVSVFQDGFAFANSLKATTQDIFDAERVEVLRGPQATLYGANSLGGVVNILSRLPALNEFEGEVRASYGEYDTTLLRGAVTLPLVQDRLSVRVGGYLNSRDGYYDNLFNGRDGQDATDEHGARLAARFEPTDRIRSDLVYSFARTTSDCSDCSNPIIGYNPSDPTAVGAGRIDVDNLGEFTNTNIPGYFRRNIHRGTLNNTIDFDNFTLTSLTGYGRLTFASLTDSDRGPGDTVFSDILVDERQRVFSQELRLASSGAGPFRWQVGAYYSDSIINQETEVGLGLPARLPIADARERFSTFALFTQNAYQLNDRLELQFGLRYDHAEKRRVDNTTSAAAETDSDALLPRLSLLYRLDDDNNVYATVSRGYKTGGTNLLLPGLPVTYGPEYLWNYEVGLKGATADRRWRYDLSAYYIDWTDQQVQQSLGIFSFITNLGATRIYGAEATVRYTVDPSLSFDVGLSYNHARYRDYFDGTAVPIFFGADPDRSGERNFLSPDLSASVAGRYVRPLSDRFDLTIAGDARYTGRRSLDSEGILIGDAFVLANASISVGDGQTRLTVFANNLFDERYSTAAFLFAGQAPITHLGAPRVAGVQLDYRF